MVGKARANATISSHEFEPPQTSTRKLDIFLTYYNKHGFLEDISFFENFLRRDSIPLKKDVVEGGPLPVLNGFVTPRSRGYNPSYP